MKVKIKVPFTLNLNLFIYLFIWDCQEAAFISLKSSCYQANGQHVNQISNDLKSKSSAQNSAIHKNVYGKVCVCTV